MRIDFSKHGKINELIQLVVSASLIACAYVCRKYTYTCWPCFSFWEWCTL